MYLENKRPEDLPMEERIKLMGNRDYKYLQAAIIQARKADGTILDGFRCLNMEVGKSELQCIKEHGAVFINKVGGHTFSLAYNQFCRRKELIYPDFKMSDIRVIHYQGGLHWYAFVGDMQVRNGEKCKWNTSGEAKRAAEIIVSGS